MLYAFWIFLALVIIGHFAFAIMQAFAWRWLAKRITALTDTEIDSSAFLGRSIASYNAAVGAGVAMTCWLQGPAEADVQSVILILIVLTALIGWWGTKGNGILYFRLLPAAAALGLLMYLAPSAGWKDINPETICTELNMFCKNGTT